MKLNQIVYVVANAKSEVVLGVYNDYYDALNAIEGCNSADVSITPVLVDSPVDGLRSMCYCEDDMNELVEEEIGYAHDLEEEAESDEDEDEDYGYDEDDEDDEDEVDEKSEILDAVDEAINRIKATLDDLLSELRD